MFEKNAPAPDGTAGPVNGFASIDSVVPPPLHVMEGLVLDKVTLTLEASRAPGEDGSEIVPKFTGLGDSEKAVQLADIAPLTFSVVCAKAVAGHALTNMSARVPDAAKMRVFMLGFRLKKGGDKTPKGKTVFVM
jgi:hypothetical protein